MKNRFLFWGLISCLILMIAGFGWESSVMLLPIVGMALAKDRTRINVKGGGTLKVQEMTSGGGLVTMFDLGYLQGVVARHDGKIVEVPNDSGYLVQLLSGGGEFTLEGTLLQVGKDEIDLLMNAADKFYYAYYAAVLSSTRVQEALRVGPDNSEVRIALGIVLQRQGRAREAEVELRREIDLFPNNTRARASLAMLYRSMGRDADAARAIDALVDAAPTREGFGLAVRLWTLFGEPARAQAVTAEARRRFGAGWKPPAPERPVS